MKRGTIALMLIAFVGGACGGACGALTVAGVHRRDILVGTLIGVVLGIVITNSALPGARVPAWQLYCAICGLFGWLGMIAGLLSSDNDIRQARKIAAESVEHDSQQRADE